MILIPKNWGEFQHYRNRRPPWIKLHRGLLDNYDFAALPMEAKALAPLLWLLASEYQDGIIDLSIEALAFRMRVDSACVSSAISALVAGGFFSAHTDASSVLADRYQYASAEREGETEGEREKEKEKGPTPREKTITGTRTHAWGAL